MSWEATARAYVPDFIRRGCTGREARPPILLRLWRSDEPKHPQQNDADNGNAQKPQEYIAHDLAFKGLGWV